MNQDAGMSVLAVFVGSVAGALLRYLTTLPLEALTSRPSTRDLFVSIAGGVALGLLLGWSVAVASVREGRWPAVILLAAAIASFGATSVLTAAVEAPLRDSLINIAATVYPAAVAAGTIYRVRRT